MHRKRWVVGWVQENLLYVKGAPEGILDRCSSIMLPDGQVVPLSEDAREEILKKMLEMAGEALRTLALAVKFDLTLGWKLALKSSKEDVFALKA